MSFEVSQDVEGRLIANIHGPLDMPTADEVIDRVLLATTEAVVDLSGVTRFDNVALLRMWWRFEDAGVQFRLRGLRIHLLAHGAAAVA
jgi:anti-anti-sigma regulatory factor